MVSMTDFPNQARTPGDPIELLVSDIDGTLVNPDKGLTARAIDAVDALAKARIGFTLVSSRPPRGMASLLKALDVRLPFAAFNGASLVAPDLSVIKALHIPADAARKALALFEARGVGVWVFADGVWLLRDPEGPKVAHERHTVGFDPTVVDGFAAVIHRIDKMVGVSDDHAHLAQVEIELQGRLGDTANAVRSQTYYLDVTHAQANKGNAVRGLCAEIGVDPARTAVIGDASNDVSMFHVAGFAVAMGQASDAVKAEASAVTGANTEDGFAAAVNDLILPRARI